MHAGEEEVLQAASVVRTGGGNWGVVCLGGCSYQAREVSSGDIIRDERVLVPQWMGGLLMHTV